MASVDFPFVRRVRAKDIRSLRERLGLTQEGFAGLLGVSRATIAQWETGRTAPNRERRLALADLSSRRSLAAKSDPLLGVEQIAVYLGINSKTVYRAIRRGRLKAARNADGIWGVMRTWGGEFMRLSYNRVATRSSDAPPEFASSVPPDYSEQILVLRRRLNWTQDDLGARLGIDRGRRYVSKWETGSRRPKPSTWAKIMALSKIGT